MVHLIRVILLFMLWNEVGSLRMNAAEKKSDALAGVPSRQLLKAYTNQMRSAPPRKTRPEPKISEAINDITEPVQRPRIVNVPIEKNAEGVPTMAVKASRPILSGGSGTKKILNQGSNRVQDLINPNKLRIIGGVAKGKKIDSPSVYLRPMMAKVREALFSTLGFMDIFTANTTRVLDTFCGSGSVGLEALSRGASFCCFVDLSPDCSSTGLLSRAFLNSPYLTNIILMQAMRNLETCGFSGQGASVCARTEEVLRNPSNYGITDPFQLVSITPPYEEVVYSDLIDAVCNSPVVVADTLVVIEYPEEMGRLPFILGGDCLYGIRNRRYGRTVLGIYVYRPNKKYNMRPDEFSI